MAHGLQIPTPYPSSPFTVPQCKFARRAIICTVNSANSHGVRRHAVQIRTACRRRGAAAPPTANVFGTLRALAAGRCTLFAIIRTANSHGEFAVRIRTACRRRGVAAPTTANVFWHVACIGSWQVHTNQCCCRHGGRRDGRWSRGGGSTDVSHHCSNCCSLLLFKLLYNLGYPGLS